MDHTPPDFSAHGILQARILEWVAMPSSRGSSQPRDQTHGIFQIMLQDIKILQPINNKLLSKLHFFPKGSVFPQILSFVYHLHDFFDIPHAINTASYGKGVDFLKFKLFVNKPLYQHHKGMSLSCQTEKTTGKASITKIRLLAYN